MKYIFSLCLLTGFLFLPNMAQASENPAGHLYIDDAGFNEWLWYVDPVTNQRALLPHGPATYKILSSKALGISDADLEKIPLGYIAVQDNSDIDDIGERFIALFERCSEDDLLCFSRTAREFIEADYHVELYSALFSAFSFVFLDSDGDGVSTVDELRIGTAPYNPDSDGDGYDDGTEIYYGYDPLGPDKLEFDMALVDRLRGRMLLQVSDEGRLWYVHPEEGKRYPMESPQVAQSTLRALAAPVDWNVLGGVSMDSMSEEIGLALQNGVFTCDDVDCFTGRMSHGQSAQYRYTIAPNVTSEEIDLTSGAEIDFRFQYIVSGELEHFFIFIDDYRVPDLSVQEVLEVLRSDTTEDTVREVLGEEFFDAFNALSSNDQEEAVSNILVAYQLLIEDLNDLIPYLGCVVDDRDLLIDATTDVMGLIEQVLALDEINEDSVLALEDDVLALEYLFEGASPISCTAEGGFMSLSL